MIVFFYQNQISRNIPIFIEFRKKQGLMNAGPLWGISREPINSQKSYICFQKLNVVVPIFSIKAILRNEYRPKMFNW